MGADTVFVFKLGRGRAKLRRTHAADMVCGGSDFIGVFHAVRFLDLQRDAALASRIVESHFGDLRRAHTDPRGVLAFPDTVEPSAGGYDELIAEVGSAGIWIRGDGAVLGSRPLPGDAFEPLSAMPEATNVVSREVPPSLAKLAVAGLSVDPLHAIQTRFVVAAPLEAMAAYYEAELGRRHLSTTREHTGFESDSVIQLVARSPGKVIVVKGERERDRSVVSVTTIDVSLRL